MSIITHCYIYKITNIANGKCYIGQTICPEKRWCQHKNNSKNKTKQYIHHIIKKYGIKNFLFEVIFVCKNMDDSDWAEERIITQYDSRNKKNGYNIGIGGQHGMSGLHHSIESKRKISQAHKGKRASAETIQKMKNSRAKVIITREWAANISESNKGKIISEEAKYNMSQAQKLVNRDYDELSRKAAEINRGKKHSPDLIKKRMINNSGFSGKHHSNESKDKISKSLRGKSKGAMPEETKNKISDAKKGMPAPNKGKTWKMLDGKRIWSKI
jgi:group I intron endonuclease